MKHATETLLIHYALFYTCMCCICEPHLSLNSRKPFAKAIDSKICHQIIVPAYSISSRSDWARTNKDKDDKVKYMTRIFFFF